MSTQGEQRSCNTLPITCFLVGQAGSSLLSACIQHTITKILAWNDQDTSLHSNQGRNIFFGENCYLHSSLPFLIRKISRSASAIMKGRKQIKRHGDHAQLCNCLELVNSGIFSSFRAPFSYKGYRLLLSPEFPAPNTY